MQITAAVAFENRSPLRLDTVDLSDPALDEVLVRIEASGLCHTLIVVDRSPERLALATELGATHTVLAGDDAVKQV